jgi:hypothetical protein
MLWLLAVVLAVIGVITLIQGQLLLGLLLLLAAALVGGGGSYSVSRRRV